MSEEKCLHIITEEDAENMVIHIHQLYYSVLDLLNRCTVKYNQYSKDVNPRIAQEKYMDVINRK